MPIVSTIEMQLIYFLGWAIINHHTGKRGHFVQVYQENPYSFVKSSTIFNRHVMMKQVAS